MNSTAVLRAESVGKRFGERTVLHAATLYAWPGRITAVLGRNGSGKSTLLKICAGVATPDFGAVHYAGKVYTQPKLHRLARHGLFYLPERGLMSHFLTVDEHLRLASADPMEREQTVNRFALGLLRANRASELSGGEKRRVDFAIATMRRPNCLLADEPFQGIAPLDVEKLSALLREMRSAGVAIVITGHEVSAVLDVADEIIWLVAGTTHSIGAPSQAVAHHQFRREYLGT